MHFHFRLNRWQRGKTEFPVAHGLRCGAWLVLFLVLSLNAAQAQSTTFTYQGRLTTGSIPADGHYDFRFTLWNAASGGAQQPQPGPITVTKDDVTITSGAFAVTLDFGPAAFSGADRFLEINVRQQNADPNAVYNTLTPRQALTATPYAFRSLTAGTAETAITATKVTGIVAVGNGGTGSGTKNFVDLSTTQLIGGDKTFSDPVGLAANGLTVGVNQLIATGNYVGIGGLNQSVTITPKLYVNGSIGIVGNQDYQFANARTRKFTLGPESFTATSSGWSARIDSGFSSNSPNGSYSLSASGGTPGNQAYFVAPVQLPDDAVITGFSGILIKNGGSLQAVIELFRANGECYVACAPDLIASATTMANAGIAFPVQASSIATGLETVNNSYHYFVRFTGEQGTQNLRLNLVQVTYQVSKVD